MKWSIVQIIAFLSLFSCGEFTTNPTVTAQKAKDTSLVEANQRNKAQFHFDALNRGDDYVIFGDSSKSFEKSRLHVELKFKPYIKFSDVHATPLGTSKAIIRPSSNRLARQYRTVITENYREKGLNFGGHYCFAYWGCGSSCQESALVDLKTGIVYDGVEASAGYEFRKDSRLLLINPPDSTGFYISGGFFEPKIYVWNEVAKKFEQR